jgi:DNA-binding transcriptional ArsR family regulator
MAISTAPAPLGWLQGIADPVRLQILEVLSGVRDASVTELLAPGSMSGQTVRRHLEDLIAVGIVEERPGESDGTTPGRPAARFRLRPELRSSVRSVFEVAL